MTIITSHSINGTDGTHAVGIKVTFAQIGSEKIFHTQTDSEGRIKQNLDPKLIVQSARYELVFDTGSFWIERGYKQNLDQVVLRFKIPDPSGDYHMPLIINPNSYSVWWSR